MTYFTEPIALHHTRQGLEDMKERKALMTRSSALAVYLFFMYYEQYAHQTPESMESLYNLYKILYSGQPNANMDEVPEQMVLDMVNDCYDNNAVKAMTMLNRLTNPDAFVKVAPTTAELYNRLVKGRFNDRSAQGIVDDMNTLLFSLVNDNHIRKMKGHTDDDSLLVPIVADEFWHLRSIVTTGASKESATLQRPLVRKAAGIYYRIMLLLYAGPLIYTNRMRDLNDIVDGWLNYPCNTDKLLMFKKLSKCTTAELFVLLNNPVLWSSYEPSTIAMEDRTKQVMFMTWNKMLYSPE